MPVTRHGRQQRKSGGVATKSEAQRIAAKHRQAAGVGEAAAVLTRPQRA